MRREELKLRYARPDESETIVDWLNQHQPVNQFNPDVLQDPSLRILCHYNSEGPVMYNMLTRSLVMESSAPKPGIDPGTAALAFRDFTKASWLHASGENISSIYALDVGGGLSTMAQNHHFELLGSTSTNGVFHPFKVYRTKTK